MIEVRERLIELHNEQFGSAVEKYGPSSYEVEVSQTYHLQFIRGYEKEIALLKQALDESGC